MTTRRDVMKSLGLGLAAATLLPTVLPGGIRSAAAQQAAGSAPDDLIMKTIGATNESVPAIGLGSFLTFDTLPGQKRDHLLEVMKSFWDGGGRVVDTSPLYGTGETTVGDAATKLGINDRLFIANKVWTTGDYLFDSSHAERSLVRSQSRLWRERFDLMQVHSLTNVNVILPLLQAWKKEGRIRYFGITHHEPAYFDQLAHWIEKGKPDFVQVHYSIFNRQAEDRVLKAAADNGAAVLVNMPFEKARLFKVVEGRKVPDFFSEVGAGNWAEFYLKWIISHPAVTCAIPGTSNPDHAAQNVAAMRGPLPDQAMRDRMVKYMDTVPGFADLEKMAWYPDKKYPGIIAQARAELKARS